MMWVTANKAQIHLYCANILLIIITELLLCQLSHVLRRSQKLTYISLNPKSCDIKSGMWRLNQDWTNAIKKESSTQMVQRYMASVSQDKAWIGRFRNVFFSVITSEASQKNDGARRTIFPLKEELFFSGFKLPKKNFRSSFYYLLLFIISRKLKFKI